MPRRAVFIPYRPKNILNKGKRADHWFWTRYSAYPYMGCQHGCEFCYCRERKYSPYEDVNDFAYVIKVKENAPELLRRGLTRAPVDLVFTGDYQPLERKFLVSRKMLEVCLDLGFPVFVLERSPLVLRDMDLLKAIKERATAVVAFSAVYTPDSINAAAMRRIEHLAPPPEKRFEAMAQVATAGILTGTCMMPIVPGFCDDDASLESVVRWTAEHGGKFVLPSSMTLSDQQSGYFFNILREHFPDRLPLYEKLYPVGSYAPGGAYWQKIALRIRELCQKYGIRDRIPRPIIPGDKHALNKRIVEVLANQVYSLEIQGETGYRTWAYRKAAWAVEDMEQNIGLFYDTMGLKGLQSIPAVGASIGKVIEQLILKERA